MPLQARYDPNTGSRDAWAPPMNTAAPQVDPWKVRPLNTPNADPYNQMGTIMNRAGEQGTLRQADEAKVRAEAKARWEAEMAAQEQDRRDRLALAQAAEARAAAAQAEATKRAEQEYQDEHSAPPLMYDDYGHLQYDTQHMTAAQRKRFLPNDSREIVVPKGDGGGGGGGTASTYVAAPPPAAAAARTSVYRSPDITDESYEYGSGPGGRRYEEAVAAYEGRNRADALKRRAEDEFRASEEERKRKAEERRKALGF